MNKQDISNQAKVPVQAIDSIFNTVGIAKDLADYTDEHLNLVIAVRDIHKKVGAKSWIEAVGLYRKPEREQQLKDIANRCLIPVEDIPEILDSMKLKVEAISDSHLELFQGICQMIQSGMSVEIAAQSSLNNAKAAAKTKADTNAVSDPAPSDRDQALPEQSAPNPEAGAALVPTQGSAQPNLTVQAIPHEHGETLQGVVDIAVDTAGFDVNGRIATKALDAAQSLDGAIDQAIWNSLTDPSRPNALSAQKVVEAIKREREERNGR